MPLLECHLCLLRRDTALQRIDDKPPPNPYMDASKSKANRDPATGIPVTDCYRDLLRNSPHQ